MKVTLIRMMKWNKTETRETNVINSHDVIDYISLKKLTAAIG